MPRRPPPANQPVRSPTHSLAATATTRTYYLLTLGELPKPNPALPSRYLVITPLRRAIQAAPGARTGRDRWPRPLRPQRPRHEPGGGLISNPDPNPNPYSNPNP